MPTVCISVAILILASLLSCAEPTAPVSSRAPASPSESRERPASSSPKVAPISSGEPSDNEVSPSPQQPASEPAGPPVVREQRQVKFAGQAETWKLVWQNSPQSVCDNPTFDCPCIGFRYGERGKLDLVRTRKSAPDDVLALTPLFQDTENPAGAEGFEEAVLQRWPVRDSDNERQPSQTEIATRPVVQIMKVGDYNHDGKASEFVLQIGTEPCGHSDAVLIGITPQHPTLHVFARAEEPNKPLVTERRVWEKLLTSKGKALVTVLTCGDHGSEIEIDAELRADAKGLHETVFTYECTDNFKRGNRIPAGQLER